MIKITVSVCLFFLTLQAFTQDTIYYDKQNKEVDDIISSETFLVESILEDKKDYAVHQKCYYSSGNLKFEKFYKDTQKKLVEGPYTYYHENGIKRSEALYSNGKLDGSFIIYWEDGSIKRRDIYKKGKFKSGKVWDEQGIEEEYYPFMVPAKFPGGEVAFQAYIKENVKFPEGKSYNKEERIKLKFKITSTGEVTEIVIIEGSNSELNAMAYEVVKNMPTWSPAKQDGKEVTVGITLPVVIVPSK